MVAKMVVSLCLSFPVTKPRTRAALQLAALLIDLQNSRSVKANDIGTRVFHPEIALD